MLSTTLASAQEASISNRPIRMVPTLSGPLPADKLGTMLMHEHVLHGVIPDEQRARSVEIAGGYLHEAAHVGIDSLACLSPERDIRLDAQIAERSPVRIVIATGSYVFHRSSRSMRLASSSICSSPRVRTRVAVSSPTLRTPSAGKGATWNNMPTIWSRPPKRAGRFCSTISA